MVEHVLGTELAALAVRIREGCGEQSTYRRRVFMLSVNCTNITETYLDFTCAAMRGLRAAEHISEERVESRVYCYYLQLCNLP